MADLTFKEILQAAQKLPQEQKAALIYSLQADREETGLTREQALAELEALRAAGAFNNVESLRGKYARPDLEISEDELSSYLHNIATEWIQELDDITKPD
jgi:hypothetical protein